MLLLCGLLPLKLGPPLKRERSPLRGGGLADACVLRQLADANVWYLSHNRSDTLLRLLPPTETRDSPG